MADTTARTKYRRIAIVALLGGALAFASSFLVSPNYQSATRLIIHGQDPNFLSPTGDSSGATTITDPTSAKALADTYGSIATSRSLAIAVVDKLDLDKKDDGSGPVHWVAGAFATAYRCTRAFVTVGFCSSPSRRETAIALVQSTVAAQLGANAGDSAGQPGSYVLEITSNGDSGKQARDIANAVADQLVLQSSAQARAGANQHLALLQKQFVVAKATLTKGIAAISKFQLDNFSTGTGTNKNSSNGSYDQLSAQLNAANSDLADAQAQRVSIDTSLASERPADDSNPTYVTLTGQRSQLDAQISGLKARISLLQTQILKVAPATASGPLAQLGILQAQLDTTRNNLTALVAGIQQARTTAATVQPGLTRLDTAGEPQYPVSPMRYLYLMIGLLLGGLAGGGLTWLELRRTAGGGGSGAEPEAEAATATTVATRNSRAAEPAPEPVLVGANGYASNGHAPNGHGGADGHAPNGQASDGRASNGHGGADGHAPNGHGGADGQAPNGRQHVADAETTGPIEVFAPPSDAGHDSLFDQFVTDDARDPHVADRADHAVQRENGPGGEDVELPAANRPRGDGQGRSGQETRASRRARQQSSGRRR